MERRFESTYTFQLLFGEFTLDPISFAAVTCIFCAGDSVPLNVGLHPMTADIMPYIRTLLGMVPDIKGTDSFKIDSIRAHYTRERITPTTTGHEIKQVVRTILLYLLGTTLFADAPSSLDLVFIMLLRDIDLIAIYDWGSYALAYLYKSMDETVRRARHFCGFWHVVLVCSSIYFPLLFFLFRINCGPC